MKTLIIVESPNKTRAIARYAREVLPGSVTVRASLGHLRDLPKGRLGVDVQQGFQPDYQVMPSRRKTVAILRTAILAAERVWLATDPDREGEAVAWHVVKVFETELKGKGVAVINFSAITRAAVQAALQKPRQLDKRLVRAAVARRVLDRLVGYTLSPRLWAAVAGKDLSAGRVQTAALHLLFEQNRQRQKPKPAEWVVDVEL